MGFTSRYGLGMQWFLYAIKRSIQFLYQVEEGRAETNRQGHEPADDVPGVRRGRHRGVVWECPYWWDGQGYPYSWLSGVRHNTALGVLGDGVSELLAWTELPGSVVAKKAGLDRQVYYPYFVNRIHRAAVGRR